MGWVKLVGIEWVLSPEISVTLFLPRSTDAFHVKYSVKDNSVHIVF